MLDNEENEHKEISDGELTKSKVKKARTPAQQEAFKEVMRKRQENIQLRKEEKIISSAKLLVEKNIMPPIETPKVYKAKKTVYQPEPEPQSESEEEIIIVKSKPKPKKKTKKIIVEDSSSDDNSSGSSGGGGGRQKHRPIVQVQRATYDKPINYFI